MSLRDVLDIAQGKAAKSDQHPLWTLLGPSASSVTPSSNSVLQQPALTFKDKTATSLRLLLCDTQNTLESFSDQVQILVKDVGGVAAQMEETARLLEDRQASSHNDFKTLLSRGQNSVTKLLDQTNSAILELKTHHVKESSRIDNLQQQLLTLTQQLALNLEHQKLTSNAMIAWMQERDAQVSHRLSNVERQLGTTTDRGTNLSAIPQSSAEKNDISPQQPPTLKQCVATQTGPPFDKAPATTVLPVVTDVTIPHTECSTADPTEDGHSSSKLVIDPPSHVTTIPTALPHLVQMMNGVAQTDSQTPLHQSISPLACVPETRRRVQTYDFCQSPLANTLGSRKRAFTTATTPPILGIDPPQQRMIVSLPSPIRQVPGRRSTSGERPLQPFLYPAASGSEAHETIALPGGPPGNVSLASQLALGEPPMKRFKSLGVRRNDRRTVRQQDLAGSDYGDDSQGG
ncbi:hypothetical protein DL93DRAFT_2164214 [Clavulina sp. PMI_390]|nr:hypothetical protein DL93DRAFT_2164214 [Clavulina sp. PMI_390]